MEQRDAGARLEEYAALIRAWSPKVDLIAPSDLSRLEERHIDDSLRALPLIDAAPPGPCVDVGSGAGFPGVPLACARPHRRWRLLEPRLRRAAFLDEVVRALDLDCEVLRLTAEAAAADPALRAAHVVATARAVAPPAGAFALLVPLVAAGGTGVVWLGEAAELPSEAAEVVAGLGTIQVG